MQLLYVCPNYNNTTYSYYGLIPDGLKKLGYNITTIKNLTDFNILNNYDVVIFGYRGFGKTLYGKKFNTKAKLFNLLGAQSSHEFPEKAETLNENNIMNLTSMYRIDFLKKTYFTNLLTFGYSFYPDLFKDYKHKKIYDVGMTGALHNSVLYPHNSFLENEKNIRQRVYDKLNSLNSKFKIFLKCSDTFSKSRIFTDEEYAVTINKTKIWIACNSAYGDIPSRNYQIPACKTLLFCNEQNENHYKHIFKDGINCVFFKNDLSDLEQKINHYLKNEDLYNKIVENAYNEFHIKHTNVQRAKDLLIIIS